MVTMVITGPRESSGHPSTAFKIERVVVLVFAGLELVVHGGIIWGWPSYVYILKQEGFYRELCDHADYAADGKEPGFDSGNRTGPLLGDALGMKVPANNSGNPATYRNFLLEHEASDKPAGKNDSFQGPPIAFITSTHSVDDGGSSEYVACYEQDAMIQLIFTVAMGIQQVCSCWLGYLVDSFGIRASRLLLSLGMLTSYLLLALVTPSTAVLLFPAMIISAACGALLLTQNYQVGNLFGPAKATVMSWLAGCFSASVLTFYLTKMAYDSGVSVRTSFSFLAGSTAILLVNTFMLPGDRIPWPLPPGFRLLARRRVSVRGPRKTPAEFEPLPASKSPIEGGSTGSTAESDVDVTKEGQVLGDVQFEKGRKRKSFHDVQRVSEVMKSRRYPAYSSCVKSAVFWLIVTWFSTLQLNVIFLFGTFNSFITRLADGDLAIVSKYTDVFLLIQVAPVISSHIFGAIVDRKKMAVCRKKTERGPYDDLQDTCLPLALTTVASIGYSACLLVPSLHVQYVTFVLVLFAMSTLWGYLSAVVAFIFPMTIFSTLFGSVRTVGGIASFLQFPIFMVVQRYLGNDPFYVMLGLIGADVITFALPVYCWFYVKRKKAAATRGESTEPVCLT